MDVYFSNCFIEAIKAKIKHGRKVKLMYFSARENEVYCPHWLWHDLQSGKVYDFHSVKEQDNWWQFFIFKGHIRERPYSLWEKWLSQ